MDEYTLEVRITQNADGDKPEKQMLHIIIPDACEDEMLDLRGSVFKSFCDI